MFSFRSRCVANRALQKDDGSSRAVSPYSSRSKRRPSSVRKLLFHFQTFEFASHRRLHNSQSYTILQLLLNTIGLTMPVCCPAGSWPQLLLSQDELNQDEPSVKDKGQVVKVPVENQQDLDVYFVKPPEGKKSLGAILVLPDVYSVRVLLPHVRSADRIGGICDALADMGWTVALAGIFRDQPFDEALRGPSNGDWTRQDVFAEDGGVDWFKQQHYDKMKALVVSVTNFLKEQTSGQSVGVLGFCYGTWLLSKSSFMGDVDFACAVGCHPATALEGVLGGDEIAMMQGLKQPTLFLSAGNDSDIYKEGGAGKAALEKSGGGVEEFNNMVHGWVSRGDVKDQGVQAGVTRAIHSIVKFFAGKMPKAT